MLDYDCRIYLAIMDVHVGDEGAEQKDLMADAEYSQSVTVKQEVLDSLPKALISSSPQVTPKTSRGRKTKGKVRNSYPCLQGTIN